MTCDFTAETHMTHMYEVPEKHVYQAEVNEYRNHIVIAPVCSKLQLPAGKTVGKCRFTNFLDATIVLLIRIWCRSHDYVY